MHYVIMTIGILVIIYNVFMFAISPGEPKTVCDMKINRLSDFEIMARNTSRSRESRLVSLGKWDDAIKAARLECGVDKIDYLDRESTSSRKLFYKIYPEYK